MVVLEPFLQWLDVVPTLPTKKPYPKKQKETCHRKTSSADIRDHNDDARVAKRA